MPFHSEPVEGHLAIRAGNGLRLYRQLGAIQQKVPIRYENGEYKISLDRDLDTRWLVLK